MRLALADAGDSINDANFDEAMAEAGQLIPISSSLEFDSSKFRQREVIPWS